MHMCPMHMPGHRAYAAVMKSAETSEIKKAAITAISLWRDRVMAHLGWNAAHWAKRASISDTTITRGMKRDAASTIKIENLHALAQAASLPSVLDFLASQPGAPASRQMDLPPAEVLSIIFDELAAEMVGARVRDSAFRPAGRALELLLRQIAENPAIHANPDALRAVVRITASQSPQTIPEA